MWGEADAWKYMDALHDNIAHTHSGSKPCRQAGAGEFPIGVSFEYRAVTTRRRRADRHRLSDRGPGWDLEASGIMKATKSSTLRGDDGLARDAAGVELYAKNSRCWRCPVWPSRWTSCRPITKTPGKNDPAWSAKNRDRILAEWIKRYDGKSEPK
jgi:iron(III) transport system substrate-binding protein